MSGRSIHVVTALVVIALCACTGGNMGNTRGGGAAPGQSGGRDTSHASAASTPAPSNATPVATTDTTKPAAKAKKP
ncbi:MAG TPA: hypothetical protein VGH98_21435 [Gemmatimonadaceae bacterium]|jgi:hypothetical protein